MIGHDRDPAEMAHSVLPGGDAAYGDGRVTVVRDDVARHIVRLVELVDETLLIHENLPADERGIIGEDVRYDETEHVHTR